MINDKISPLQLTTLRKLPTGMTEANHLSQFYLTEPEKMDGVLAYAFGTENKSVLSMITGGLGNTKYVHNREYTWDLHGQNERRVSISRNHLGGGTTPGVGGTYFKIYFDEKLFARTELIASANGTQLYVSDDPYQDGTDWVYTVQLYDPNLSSVTVDQVDLGGSFSKDFSPVEEFSDQGGQTYYSAPMKFTNQLTTLRKEYSCTRDAALDGQYMIMKLYSPDGKSTTMWTKLQEWTFLAQFQQEIDRSFVYSIYNGAGTPNGPMKGKNGRPVFTGAGLRQQISPANIRTYSRLTYQILQDFLEDLAYAGKQHGSDLKFLALTGLQGMKEFDRACSEYARGNNFTVTNNGTFIKGDGSNLTLTGHFKTIEFMNGITLTVQRFEPYDDDVRNGANLHPLTKKPLESYRFTILNIGQDNNGGSALKRVAKEKSDSIMWYEAGSITPTGDVANSMSTMRGSAADGYKVHKIVSCGVYMENPLMSGELLYDFSL